MSHSLFKDIISETVTILNIIYRPVFCLNHNVSETGFYLRLQVEPTPKIALLSPTE
jgi:hypothetical protein